MSAVDETKRTEDEEHDDHQDDEHQDDEHGDELEPEPDAEPARDPAEGLEEPTDLMIAELRAANDEHHDHVRVIMGSFVEGFVPCETCGGLGIAYPQPTGPEFEHAQGLETCPTCAGRGELETGSKRQGYTLIQCGRCGGQGYVGQQQHAGAEQTAATVASFPQPPDGQQAPPASSQPPSTDPRVQALRDEGFIVLEKPGS